MKALKESLAGAREGSSLQRGEDGGAEILGGAGDVTGRSHWARVCGGGGSLRQTEAVMQSFRDEGSWSSKMVRLVTLCVLARRIVFCPLAEWGEEMQMWEGLLEEMSADQDSSVAVPGT